MKRKGKYGRPVNAARAARALALVGLSRAEFVRRFNLASGHRISETDAWRWFKSPRGLSGEASLFLRMQVHLTHLRRRLTRAACALSLARSAAGGALDAEAAQLLARVAAVLADPDPALRAKAKRRIELLESDHRFHRTVVAPSRSDQHPG